MSDKYLRIVGKKRDYFGGNQSWFESAVLQNSGCGIVAACDSVLRLSGKVDLDHEAYMERLVEASNYVSPIRLPFKMKPVMIGDHEFLGSFGVPVGRFRKGIQKLAKKYGVTLKTKVLLYKSRRRLMDLVKGGTPVVLLLVAPFGNLKLYDPDDMKFFGSVGFHWVTAVGVSEDEEEIYVSSWGRKYKILVSDLKKFSIGAIPVQLLTI